MSSDLSPTTPTDTNSPSVLTRLLRLHVVKARTGRSRSCIYDDIKRGSFPRPVKLGPRAVAWVESEVDAWIAARIEARDDAAVAS
jgi:prophage regulatory protein